MKIRNNLKHIIKRGLLSSLLIALACSCLADPWSGPTKIQFIYPAKEGLVFLSVFKNPAVSTCDLGSRFLIPINHVNYNVMVSGMMAAFMADKTINFYYDDSQKSCIPAIDRFHIYK